MKKQFSLLSTALIGTLLIACSPARTADSTAEQSKASVLKVQQFDSLSFGEGGVFWRDFELRVARAGQYRIRISGHSPQGDTLWLEDYRNNSDGRRYDISGRLILGSSPNKQTRSVDGAPLDTGKHLMRIHFTDADFVPELIEFELLSELRKEGKVLQQDMEGTDWELVWSDEFETDGLPDTSKWTYKIGDWGWGNRELQYYTHGRRENARCENGHLIIEARKNDGDMPWSSARLSTQGKVGFIYGKIEFRAKVPSGLGTWSAGWLLGSRYRDELSWPYCGEIDVLECVGYEIDESTGNGYNHASCHTRAYYFKQNNQITAKIAVEDMKDTWHRYSIEWYPDSVLAFVDDRHYYTYDKKANAWEWPFDRAQDIIINLAVGGGWGGREGVDSTMTSQQFHLDYVRVYAKK